MDSVRNVARSDNGQAPASSRATALEHRASTATRHSLQESMLPLARNSFGLVRAFRHRLPQHITGHTGPVIEE